MSDLHCIGPFGAAPHAQQSGVTQARSVPLWFYKQRVRENHLNMGLHAQKRCSWQVTALAVHSPVGQAKQQRAVSDAAPLTAAPGWLDTHADVMLLLLLLNRHM